MKIELELSPLEAKRLQGICKQICNSHRRYANAPLGRSTIYDLSKEDTHILTKVSAAISNNEIDLVINKAFAKYRN